MLVTRILFLFLSLLLSGQICASFKTRPEAEVIQTREGDRFLRRLNLKGLIEVRSAKSLGLIWSSKIDGFSRTFSEYHLSLDGSCIVRIRGNHEVNAMQDVCMEFSFQDGKVRKIKAEEIVDRLHETKSKFSVVPRYLWFKKIKNVWDSKIEFEDSDGVSRSVIIEAYDKSKK